MTDEFDSALIPLPFVKGGVRGELVLLSPFLPSDEGRCHAVTESLICMLSLLLIVKEVTKKSSHDTNSRQHHMISIFWLFFALRTSNFVLGNRVS